MGGWIPYRWQPRQAPVDVLNVRLGIVYDYLTKIGALPCVPLPEAVIDGYIMPMIAELVRDQIALILSLELPAQKVIAEDLAVTQPETVQGKQAIQDLADNIFDIINNSYIEKGTNFTKAQLPAINIIYGRSDYAANVGNNIEQSSSSNYSIEVHVFTKHVQKDNEIVEGDQKSARIVARILGILRGILQSGQYVTLGDEFKGIVEKRRVTSVDVFQPDFQEHDGLHGLVGLLNVEAIFREGSPELTGENLTATISNITVKLRTDDDGKIIQIET